MSLPDARFKPRSTVARFLAVSAAHLLGADLSTPALGLAHERKAGSRFGSGSIHGLFDGRAEEQEPRPDFENTQPGWHEAA